MEGQKEAEAVVAQLQGAVNGELVAAETPIHPAAKMLDECIQETKIDRLNGENERYQKQCKDLKVELEQQKADEADIYYYLHKKLDDNYDVIAKLEKQVLTEQTDRQREVSKYEETIDELRMTSEAKIRDLSERLQDVEEENFALTEFREKKKEYEDMIARLESELQQQMKEQQEIISDLDRKNVQEKEKIKKEMLIKIKETKQNLLSMTEDQLHTTTKRTIMENEQMITELQYQSKETEKLLMKNEKLQRENQVLKRDLDLKVEGEQELAKRTHFYQKLIKKLNEKLKVKDESERELTESHYKVEVEKHEAEKNSNSALVSWEGKCRQLQYKAEQLEKSLAISRDQAKQAQAQQDQMLLLQDETVRFLLASMEDLRSDIAHAAAGGGAGSIVAQNTNQYDQEAGGTGIQAALTDGAAGAGGSVLMQGDGTDLTLLVANQRQEVISQLIQKLYTYQLQLRNHGLLGVSSPSQVSIGLNMMNSHLDGDGTQKWSLPPIYNAAGSGSVQPQREQAGSGNQQAGMLLGSLAGLGSANDSHVGGLISLNQHTVPTLAMGATGPGVPNLQANSVPIKNTSLEKPPMRSIGIQTISTSKSYFFGGTGGGSEVGKNGGSYQKPFKPNSGGRVNKRNPNPLGFSGNDFNRNAATQQQLECVPPLKSWGTGSTNAPRHKNDKRGSQGVNRKYLSPNSMQYTKVPPSGVGSFNGQMTGSSMSNTNQ